jgi:hypothetical protein
LGFHITGRLKRRERLRECVWRGVGARRQEIGYDRGWWNLYCFGRHHPSGSEIVRNLLLYIIFSTRAISGHILHSTIPRTTCSKRRGYHTQISLSCLEPLPRLGFFDVRRTASRHKRPGKHRNRKFNMGIAPNQMLLTRLHPALTLRKNLTFAFFPNRNKREIWVRRTEHVLGSEGQRRG